MDKKTAAYLLESLLERIECDQIGSVSKAERQALTVALQTLRGTTFSPIDESASDQLGHDNGSKASVDTHQDHGFPPVATSDSILIPSSSLPALPEITLVLDSVERDAPSDPDVLLCLDFGTAMSKAFATHDTDDHLDLELGKAAGRTGYALPSSIFISTEGKVFFGYEAIETSQDLVESGRERLDSIKGWLSLRTEGNLDGDSCLLHKSLNPTDLKLTQGDMIRIYLAYLTDITCKALGDWKVGDENVSRYVKRRYARPCWPDPAQAEWANKIMRTMLAEAQIIADTFSGQWAGGIDVSRLKAAIEQAKTLEKRPDYLIDVGIPEPVAVAAAAFTDSENLRDAFVVVDVGAGTTDFGLFVSTTSKESGDPLVFQVPVSIQGLMQAGDKVDAMLRAFIMKKESIDTHDIAGRLIVADLGRRIRLLKEILFKVGKLEYALSDGTIGSVTLEEFLADEAMKRFASAIEDGFKKSLSAADDTWLHWLAMPGVYLHVVLTGGSSRLPMMRSLGAGVIDVRGHKIMRKAVDPTPEWLDDASSELVEMYPQLAVAMGGASEELPQTLSAPLVFAGGNGKTLYQAGKLQISGV